jgi:hypothetical protein
VGAVFLLAAWPRAGTSITPSTACGAEPLICRHCECCYCLRFAEALRQPELCSISLGHRGCALRSTRPAGRLPVAQRTTGPATRTALVGFDLREAGSIRPLSGGNVFWRRGPVVVVAVPPSPLLAPRAFGKIRTWRPARRQADEPPDSCPPLASAGWTGSRDCRGRRGRRRGAADDADRSRWGGQDSAGAGRCSEVQRRASPTV